MPKKTIRKLSADQRVRFIIAGGFAAAVNWVVRFPLNLVMPFSAAVIVAMLIGMAVGFVSYRNFVFTGSTQPLWNQLRDFFLVNCAGMLVTFVVSVGLNHGLSPFFPWPAGVEAFSHAMGILAGAFANYFGHKHFSFRVK